MTYTVVAGDTLYDIAQRHGITLEQLYSLNPGSSDHVYDLQPGTVLKVSQQQQNQYQAPAPQQYQQQEQQQQQQQQQQNTYSAPQENKTEEHHEEKHGLFDSTGAKIAAGVLGTAAVAGLGAFAVHQYKKSHQDDDKKEY